MRLLLRIVPLTLFLGMAVLLYRGLFLDPANLPSALVGKPFPDFSLPALSDTPHNLTRQDLLGQPALVNVWATWCPSCRQEHAMLNRLAQQGVVIHGINYKDERASAQRWLRTLRNPYRLNIEDATGALGLNLGVYGAPETFVVDARGVVRARHAGVVDEGVWRHKLEPLYRQLTAEAMQ